MKKTLLFVLPLIAGCYAEGESRFISSGETRQYISLGACEAEATATFSGGGPVYSGFECRSMFLWMVRTVTRYTEGTLEWSTES